jgi:putative hydrolase of the HAD superfamily
MSARGRCSSSSRKEKEARVAPRLSHLIGVRRFELRTSPTRTERATRLRHTPNGRKGSASTRPSPARTGVPRNWRLSSPTVLRAVIFDVDFTIAQPGPDLGPGGYVRLGARHGLVLDPARYDGARRAAFAALKRHPELDHDQEIWILFTEQIIRGMGGVGETYAAAAEMTANWEHAHHFELYDDARPALAALRVHGLKLGLLSNTQRDLELFVAHHDLHVDAVLTSRLHGKTKPHQSIFRRILELLAVTAAEAVMVGDTISDDVEGARAVGMRAILVDREGAYPDGADHLDDLRALPRMLGLV